MKRYEILRIFVIYAAGGILSRPAYKNATAVIVESARDHIADGGKMVLGFT